MCKEDFLFQYRFVSEHNEDAVPKADAYREVFIFKNCPKRLDKAGLLRFSLFNHVGRFESMTIVRVRIAYKMNIGIKK